ncbi:Plant peroxidase [Populus alba x Populus x berolinensis]|nr:Plant peroxidase [Populus alba x Populus x berolinensis]
MEDVLTELPPPSRFFQEDLDNFATLSPPLSSPSLLFSDPKPDQPLCPSLLIIALSSPSLYIFHHISSKTLIGSLVLPEIPFSGNSSEPSLGDKSCNIYALNDMDNLTLVVLVQCSISAERSSAVAKLLIGDQIIPKRVLIMDSVQSQNFRGKLAPDETYVFKLETSAERKGLDGDVCGGSSLLKGLDYFPSGSVLDGLAAALLARCQMRKIRGTLCVSWPRYGVYVVAMVKSLLQRNVLPGFDLSTIGDAKDKSSSGSLHASDPPLTLDHYASTCPDVFEIVKKEMECEVLSDPRNAALILRLHFHDCFVQVGGPYWDVPVGRKDSKTASFELAASNIPTADEGLLLSLTRAHTIGMARCENFRSRIYGDFETTSDRSPMSETYLNSLKSTCPAAGGSGDNNISAMDYATPNLFDNSFYQLLLKGDGLLNSDQELYSSMLGIETKNLVIKYAHDSLAFFQQFADSMVKMGNITNPDSFVNGEVRTNCRFVNT